MDGLWIRFTGRGQRALKPKHQAYLVALGCRVIKNSVQIPSPHHLKTWHPNPPSCSGHSPWSPPRLTPLSSSPMTHLSGSPVNTSRICPHLTTPPQLPSSWPELSQGCPTWCPSLFPGPTTISFAYGCLRNHFKT